MSVNATFSLPRFVQMGKAHFTEKKRSYFWFFAIISMVYFFILLMFTIDDVASYQTQAQAAFYYMGLITTGYIFALRYFSSMAKPESALLELMQPTSVFEKWLMASIMILIVYPIIYTLLFLTMTYPVSALSASGHDYSLRYQFFIPLKYMVTSDYGNAIHPLEQVPAWIIYFSICGYALTTSLLFKKLPMIKSFALGFCLFLFFLMIVITVTDKQVEAFGFWFSDRRICNACGVVSVINILFWVVAPLLLWAASFWALKERDIS